MQILRGHDAALFGRILSKRIKFIFSIYFSIDFSLMKNLYKITKFERNIEYCLIFSINFILYCVLLFYVL